MGWRKEKKNRLAAAPGSPQPPCHRCKGQMLIDWRGGFGCRLFLFPPESGDQLWLATGRDKCRLAQPALPGASLPLPTLSLRMEPAPRSLGWAGGSQRVSLGKKGLRDGRWAPPTHWETAAASFPLSERDAHTPWCYYALYCNPEPPFCSFLLFYGYQLEGSKDGPGRGRGSPGRLWALLGRGSSVLQLGAC